MCGWSSAWAASTREGVWRLTEPARPPARLEAIQFLVENGIPAGVLMAPLLSGISDGCKSIDAVVSAATQHRAQFLAANLLFVRPGSKERFMPLIKEAYPRLVPAYAVLYRNNYAPGNTPGRC